MLHLSTPTGGSWANEGFGEGGRCDKWAGLSKDDDPLPVIIKNQLA